MTKLLISALKIFILLVLAAAAAFGALLLADYLGWPRWVAAVMVAGLFFVIVSILLLRRYYFRRREAKFVKRVVAQDQKAIAAAPAHERRQLAELQARWTAAVATLRASRLSRRGDPLYSMPWFMIFGETGSGKSTAVSHARLKNILTDAGPARGIAGTRNCDWWFFKNAIVLDTAGRYAVPLAEEDSGEWQRFLSLLAKYRRKEPLNGLIVTLPADHLLAGDADSLTEYGRNLRLRIDQLMRVLGAKFPVYLLITKIDLILGMTAMAGLLPETLRGQAMGLLNPSESGDPLEFLEGALGHISRRLKALRLKLTARVGKAGGRAVLFPDELERLAPAIRAFVEGAFHENPYQETPFFRGVFISSGRQSGLTRSGVLGSLDSLKDCQWHLPDTGLGLFLQDFFDAILPRDRTGHRPLGEYLSWRRATANLALAAWLLLLITGIGLAGFSYLHLRQTLQPAYEAFHQAPQLGASLADDLTTLGLLRDRIAEMEQRLRNPLWSMAGFGQGRRAVAGLKQRYNQWFRRYVLLSTDEAMRARFTEAGSHPGNEAAIAYLEYLVWRVDTLKAREAGKPKSDAPGQEGPIQALTLAAGGRLPYVASYFPDMYRSYAIWESDGGILRRERTDMQQLADRIVEIQGRDLHWLVAWADTRPDLTAVTLADFWDGPGRATQAADIAGAYTTQGKAEIARLMDQLALAVRDSNDFQRRAVLFWQWYAQEYYDHWTRFARDFGLGKEKLLSRDDWLNASATMATLSNPYFNLIVRMEEEFTAVRQILPHADIDRLAREFVYIVYSYRAEQGKATLKEQIAEKVHRLEAHLERLDQSLAAVAQFKQYMAQLDAFVPLTTTMNSAYRFAVQNFGQAADTGQSSPVEVALTAMTKMRSLLGRERAAEEPFWRLVEGPLAFLVTLTTYESACGVNELWQSQVVAETVNTPQRELWGALFGDQGKVDAFLSGPAKPFLRRTREGWAAGTWLGVTFPVRPAFLSFLDQGAVRRQQLQPKYTVSVATVPTDVNADAKSEPYLTRLILQCAGGQQTLENYNSPANLDFVWEPDTCDDVTLTIYFQETTLSRTWRGQWGFRDFLRRFRDGREVYTPNDFPDQRATLNRLGVRRIQVNYLIKNADPLLAVEQYPPLKVPDQAAHCWSGLGTGPVEGDLWRSATDASAEPATPPTGTPTATPPGPSKGGSR